jgi:uncharacterized protein YcbK (DUF882 family)
MNNPTGYITHDFQWEEFYCHGSRPGGVHEGIECEMPKMVQTNILRLVRNVLQPLRSYLGVPIYIVSGYRCKAHNHAVHGARESQHMFGTAADIYIKELTSKQLYKVLDLHMKHRNKLGPGGMGLYPNWVHVDIRYTERAIRW